MARVDILVPCYNTARFLPAALDSVIAQTYTDWRIVLVDDGSTDDTRAIAESYAARLGSRFLYVHQQNRGLSAARNTGLRAAGSFDSGSEYVALLDADDVWLPNRLAASVQSLDEHPEAGLSYGFVRCIDEVGTVVSTHDQLLSGAEGHIARAIYMRRIDLPCPTMTFRRSALDDRGGFDETMRATEDRDLWLRIAQRSTVVRVPEIVALYRRSAGAMTNDSDRMFRAQMRFIQKHRGSPGCDVSAERIARSSVYRQQAETLSAQGKTERALRAAVHALWLRPFDRGNLRTAASVLKHGLV